MDKTVYVNNYDPPEYDKRAIYRYAGIREGFGGVFDKVDECIAEAEGLLTYKVCFRRFEVTEYFGTLNLGFTRISGGLTDYFRGCDHLWLFAATLGLPIDRLIARYSAVSPIKAILFQALGTERIESLCNTFEADIAKLEELNGYKIKPRFSPGYGHAPLEMQSDVFAALDCQRKIGLTLNKSLLMSPSKSVTAFIGVHKD